MRQQIGNGTLEANSYLFFHFSFLQVFLVLYIVVDYG